MIPKEFIASLDLPAEKAAALQAAIKKEVYFNGLLYRAGIAPGAAAAILRATDTTGIDESKDALNLERVRVEWTDFQTHK